MLLFYPSEFMSYSLHAQYTSNTTRCIRRTVLFTISQFRYNEMHYEDRQVRVTKAFHGVSTVTKILLHTLLSSFPNAVQRYRKSTSGVNRRYTCYSRFYAFPIM